ncbi:MAG: ferredoxin [Bacteroidota bacterium]|nr:ferredoxin [Bacteroidota bacterium]
MNKKKYKVNEECISCRACVEVAGNNFKMGESGLAYVVKQPENEDELEQCEAALDVCPVAAIERIEETPKEEEVKAIIASSNVKEVFDEHPKLKDVLIELSPKFKKILNPVMYSTLARFASFNDAAKVTKISICEILHQLNGALGTTAQLEKIAPDCIREEEQSDITQYSQEISWDEPAERYIYNHDSMPEIIKKVSELNPQEAIVLISVEKPSELVQSAKGLGFKLNIEEGNDYRISIFNPEEESTEEPEADWKDNKSKFEELDVRSMKTDPFDVILKKAYEVKEGSGFMLVQQFEPIPIINMLSEMGYEHVTEQAGSAEFKVYFHKTPVEIDENAPKTEKTDVVIQSATPVAYPVIMKLLQSEVIRKSLNIKELKVWEETEKHLAWITNGKADISFSALITAAKLKNSDIKIPGLFVWDNFVMLTRYHAKGFEDIKGKEIYTPLFDEAPPAKITKYLIEASGLDSKDFKFVYGKPFGRPEKIYADFVTGKTDTAILREPEASYAIKIMQDRGEDISVISYNKIWNDINPGFGSFPNAGIVLKGEFARKNPELTKVFLNELKKAIEWVNENRKDAANLSFDMMRQPTDRVELFLNRVNFEYKSGDELIEKVKAYFDILTAQGVVETEITDDFYDIFKL